MKTTYVFGHKNPDTDSVCSAIALSYLKNQLGMNTEPRILGHLNNETKFVLDYFKIEEPRYLNDVKLQIKDIDYGKGHMCNAKQSLYEVIYYLKEHHLSTIPVVNDKKKFLGLLSMKDITNELISWDYDGINTSYDNILKTIQGQAILRFEDEIKGNVLVASYRSTTFINDIELNKNDILIIGDRHSIIEYAVNSGVKLIIITGDNQIKEDHLELAKKNHVNIIKTSLRTFNVVKIIGMCNYAETLMYSKNIVSFQENDYVNDFVNQANKLKYKVFPVLTAKKECLGVIQINDSANKHKKQVILVDHNEKSQSADGLDEADIIEIVDHHKIGTIGTKEPINFRNMPVGCTASIIYMMFKENRLSIPKNIAGIMLSSIISDTLLFRSPTTTEIDKEIAYNLSNIAEVDIEKYASKDDLEEIIKNNKIKNHVNFANVIDENSSQNKILKKLYDSKKYEKEFEIFKKNNAKRLESKALYRVLREINNSYNYNNWSYIDKNLYNRDIVSEKDYQNRVNEIKAIKSKEIDFYYFKQYLAEDSLKKARKNLNQKGIKLNGDMLCGFSFDEVWAHPKAFIPNTTIGWSLPALNLDSNEGIELLKEKTRFYAERFDGIRMDASWTYINQPNIKNGIKNTKYYEDKILNIIEDEVKKIKGDSWDLKNMKKNLRFSKRIMLKD